MTSDRAEKLMKVAFSIATIIVEDSSYTTGILKSIATLAVKIFDEIKET